MQEMEAAEVVKKVQDGETIEIDLGENKAYLSNDEIIIEKVDREGFSFIQDSDFTVAIDTTLTRELIQEGEIRDFVRYVQTMRKNAGFQVEDRIVVKIDLPDNIKNALDNYLDFFKNETLAKRVEMEFFSGEFDKELEIGGSKVRVSISRLK